MSDQPLSEEVKRRLDELQAELDGLYAEMQRVRQKTQDLLKDVLVRKDEDAVVQLRRKLGTE